MKETKKTKSVPLTEETLSKKVNETLDQKMKRLVEQKLHTKGQATV